MPSGKPPKKMVGGPIPHRPLRGHHLATKIFELDARIQEKPSLFKTIFIHLERAARARLLSTLRKASRMQKNSIAFSWMKNYPLKPKVNWPVKSLAFCFQPRPMPF